MSNMQFNDEMTFNIETLLGDAPYPYWLLNGADGEIVWANQEAERWLGQSLRVQKAKTISQLVTLPSEIGEGYVRSLKNASSVIIRNSQIKFKKAEPILCDASLFPAGKNIVLMLQETTIQSEGTVDTIDAFSAMGRMLAHEIKNPLAGISGAVQLLKSDIHGAEPLSLLDLIGGEIERIGRLVDRMEKLGDKDPDNSSAVNVHEVLHRAAKIMSTQQNRTVKFIEVYDPSLPSILADEDTLMQALLNLIKNAVEAVEQSGQGGEITLKTLFRAGVRKRRSGDEKTSALPIEIQIIDDGPGIPEPIRAQIFQPFVSNKPTGQGLGLAVVSKIVKAHHGIIEVSSRPGRTQFSILLPFNHEVSS